MGKKLTVSAGTVSENLQGFLLSFRVMVAVGVYSTWQLTDDSTNVLPLHLVSYSPSEGHGDFVAKVNLTAATDSIFHLTYS